MMLLAAHRHDWMFLPSLREYFTLYGCEDRCAVRAPT